jgi:tetratricopeptide (TPR) repeat protein
VWTEIFHLNRYCANYNYLLVLKMKNGQALPLRNEGNAYFRQSKFYEALISYNKSLCNSFESSSENSDLALAYANRSAVYLELSQVDKCLENIKLARDNGYPNESKLKEREEKCLKLQERMADVMEEFPENDPENFFKLSYPPHEKVPSIVNCVEVQEKPKFGRCVVATQDLNPGDIISIQKMLFIKMQSGASYSRCANCYKSNLLSLIPCNLFCASSELRNLKFICLVINSFKLFSAMFCNEECLKKGLERGHLSECFSLDMLKEKFQDMPLNSQGWEQPIPMFINAIAESLSIAGSVENLRNLMKPTNVDTIFDCEFSGSEELRPLEMFNYLKDDTKPKVQVSSLESAKMMMKMPEFFIKNFIKSENDREYLTNLLARFIRIRDLHSLNALIYNKLHFTGISSHKLYFKHSCDPNLGLLTFNDSIVYVATKPIAEGEPLTVSYLG